MALDGSGGWTGILNLYDTYGSIIISKLSLYYYVLCMFFAKVVSKKEVDIN